jgi:putative transposase
MHDVLSDGRRFRTLSVLDLATRECLAIEVDTTLPAQRVVRPLDQRMLWHGAPQRITLDNGPEVTGQALDVWAYQRRALAP